MKVQMTARPVFLVVLALVLFASIGLFAQAPNGSTSTPTSASPKIVVSAAVTDTSATDMLPAPATGLRNYITSIQCINVSSSTQAAAQVKDGSTVIAMIPCTPGSINTRLTFDVTTGTGPIRQPTSATKLTMNATASTTSVYFQMTGYTAR